MMPLAPERSTMCVPAKPKANFSIDFIVGSSSNNNNNNKSPSPPARRGSPSSPGSPLSARQALHPYARPSTASPPTTASSMGSPTSPALDEEEVRARLLNLQAAQAAALPGAGALHGLLPLGGLHPSPHHPGHPLPPHLLAAHPGAHGGHGGPPKDSFPLYPWLLSRHSRMYPHHHRFPGVPGPDFAGYLLHPFRKPKRIRTAFSPSQLLKLEHAFENNHYVVGAERKQVAQALGLSETQVKVWFQNRRTKHKRTEQEEEAKRKSTPTGNNNNNNNKDEPSSGNSGSQEQSLWKDERHRPVDLSSHDSHDDSSDVDSES
ncbi:hypothetical protein ONE63_009250 [Megalurothrips usitatus]|uniref:Homeobox domain-containing protein n=1 Tax=Megalurothrips usitatus TaxID=439358 RepID=A0AAV7XKI7_9NEOP|nr:hypothetical protein ONE63_009250 [Megalurothrips usitatus]